VIRTETYCGGALVKEVAMVDIMSAQTMRHEYTDGRHRWLLHGEEIGEAVAKAMILRAAVQRVLDETRGECEFGCCCATARPVLESAMDATR
jgi:hypothetical protein